MGKRSIKADANLVSVAKHMKAMGMSPNDFIETYGKDERERRILATHLHALRLTTYGEYNGEYAIYWEP